MSQKVYFKNGPKLSREEVDQKRDALRLSLVSQIEHFLNTDELFQNQSITVSFFEEGISSLVAFIDTNEQKYVLKIPLNSTVTEGSEALFLKNWESAHVSVPHIYSEGKFGDRPYVLMQFIDAPTVLEKFVGDEEFLGKVNFEIGKILKAMHAPEASGFGKVINGRGEYDSFDQWIDSPDMKKREDYIREHGLLREQKHGSYDAAKQVLVEYIGNNTKSSYCHFDYGAQHLFATEPFTVFDPNPLFNHGLIDLGKTLVNYISQSGDFPQKLLEGYEEGEKIDPQILHASIYLNIVYKLSYQHQKKREGVINNFYKYLSGHQSV